MFLTIGLALGLFIVATLGLVLAGLQDRLGKADVALVLGSKVELDGRPSLRLQARLDRTLELYRAGYFPAVIASGGVGKEGFDEAAVMKDYLVTAGIPAEQVIVDSLGNNTFLSARKTLEIVRERKLSSVLVISQYFHIPRSQLALERFGISPVYTAHARWFELRDLYSAPRELIGYVRYSLRRYDTAPGSPDAGF
jgi:vancomycin permeability regulator SanA